MRVLPLLGPQALVYLVLNLLLFTHLLLAHVVTHGRVVLDQMQLPLDEARVHQLEFVGFLCQGKLLIT